MEGRNNSSLTNEAMLAEARAFQKEVTRGKDHRGHGGVSSQRPGSYGPGAQAAAGTPRYVSRQSVAPNLATPDQFFGRQSHPPPPPSAPRSPTVPATQQPQSRPVDDYEPMQVDANPAPPSETKATAQPTGRGLVGSRWATSASLNASAPVFAPVPPAYAAIGTDKAGATTNKAPAFPTSSQNATLDTPEVPKASKGLLGSKWASNALPASPSPMTLKYPDPSTLEPVYRSEDWLSDLSAEYKELSVKSKNVSENQPSRITPPAPAHPAGVQTAAETAKSPTTECQQSGQSPTTFSAAPQKNTAVQSAAPAVAPNRASDTKPGPSVESSRAAPSAQAANNQGGIFNDTAFKDWYNSQFMRRKA